MVEDRFSPLRQGRRRKAEPPSQKRHGRPSVTVSTDVQMAKILFSLELKFVFVDDVCL